MRRMDAQAQFNQVFERLPKNEQLALRCCVIGDRRCLGELVNTLHKELYEKHRATLGCWSPWRFPMLTLVVARVAVLEQLDDRQYSRRAIAKLMDRKDFRNADYAEQVRPPLSACRYVLKCWLRAIEGAQDTV